MKTSAVVEKPAEKRPKRRERGEGRVYKRGYTWWIQYYNQGQQVRESSESEVKQVALELLQRRLTEVKDGAAPNRSLTYDQMRDDLYKYFEVQKHKSLLTRKDGTRYIGPAPALDEFFAGFRAKDIATEDLIRFQAARQKQGMSNSAINGSMRILRRMFRWQVQKKKFAPNLVPHFPMLDKDTARDDFLTVEEYEKVLAGLPDHIKPLFICSYCTGARKSELLRLRWREVDMKEGFLFFAVTKNDEPREVPFVGPMRETLEAQRAKYPDSEFVFVQPNGKPIKDFRRVWEKAVAVLPGKHLWHGNRRSMAVNLMDAGTPEQLAMEITGHKDTTTFRGYRRLLRKNKTAAAANLAAHLKGAK